MRIEQAKTEHNRAASLYNLLMIIEIELGNWLLNWQRFYSLRQLDIRRKTEWQLPNATRLKVLTHRAILGDNNRELDGEEITQEDNLKKRVVIQISLMFQIYFRFVVIIARCNGLCSTLGKLLASLFVSKNFTKILNFKCHSNYLLVVPSTWINNHLRDQEQCICCLYLNFQIFFPNASYRSFQIFGPPSFQRLPS